MIVTGNKRQEDKIIYLENVTKKMYPEISIEYFDETFRHCIEIALKKHNYNQWSDVASELPVTRRVFFESILDELKTQLSGAGLDEGQISSLLRKLNKKNRKYLG